MGTPTVNTALTIAILRIGLVIIMGSEAFQREKMYQMTMTVFRSILRRGLINKEDYYEIQKMMLKKYNPVIGSLSV